MPSVGRYTLLRRVATGGMAEVWKAKVQGPAGFSKTVAIKKVLPHLVDDENFIEMFIEEAKLVAELVHPNIVQVFDFGELGPREYFLAMEYVPGSNVGRLQKRLLEKGKLLPAGLAVYIAAESARGLGAAHMKTDPVGNPLNIVHRDVSPQNILLSYSGEVKVSDFGIAKVATASTRTAEGMVRGKLAYMSPEQANGQPLDGRADLFALGIILWELLSGKRLFGESSTAEIYGKVSRFEGLSPEQRAAIPPGLVDVVAMALNADPAKRYANMLQFESTLTSLLGAQGNVRAREGLAALMQSAFEDERRVESTPTNEVPAESFGGGTSGVVGGVSDRAIQETVISPASPVSSLTLQSAVQVRGVTPAPGPGPVAEPTSSPQRSGMFAAAGAGAVVLLLVIVLGAKAIFGGAKTAPTPTPLAVATIAPSVAATATIATTPTATLPTTATPAIAKATPTTATAPSPAPTRVAVVSHGTGSLSVKARPWVEVWVDGRQATKETPLRDFKVPAGNHLIRFVNAALHYDAAKNIVVPASGDVAISVDVAKNTVTVQ